METSIFVKIEVIIFLFSLIYIVSFIAEKVFHAYFKVKNYIEPKKVEKKPKKSRKKVKVTTNKEVAKVVKLSPQDKEKLQDIVKRAKLNSSK
jgi:Na+-transporting methylmalonyl-CoA/oxaloacetate decarboxylase gamma subunit